MKKGIATGTALILIVAFSMVVVFGALMMVPAKEIVTKDEIIEEKIALSACDPRATTPPEIRPAVINKVNTSATEYLTGTLRVYEGNHMNKETIPEGDFVTTFTLLNTGQPATSSGIKTVVCDKTYTLVLPGVDGTSVSAMGVVTMDGNDKPITLDGAKQAGLIFRVYDENNRGYVYASAEATASDWQPTADTFFSTTSNSSGLAVGAGGNFKYTIYAKINGTSATNTVFNDPTGEMIIAIDGDDLSDWLEPALTFTYKGVGQSLTEMANVPSKISNDGYDYAYTVGGNTVIAGAGAGGYQVGEAEIGISGDPKSGTDPSDNFVVALMSSGQFKHTSDEGLSIGFNKDDSSETYVYTAQKVTLTMA